MKILSVVGARPNFMKIAPFARAVNKKKNIKHILVHTGQHYDYKMSESFFKELGIPKPNINLNVGSSSHAHQTSQIMIKFEKVLIKERPDLIVVVGDVNSTMACSLVATKLHIPVAHIEAGLRSFDRKMPEEINRLVTDSVADILFTTCRDADLNLIKEGVPRSRIFFTGNIMIDTLMYNLKKASKSKIIKNLDLKKKDYASVTLHRPSNVDSKKSLMQIFTALSEVQKDIKIVFPIHPRAKKNLLKYFSKNYLKRLKNLILIQPLGYLDFNYLMNNSKFVITDSGGIQEETTVLGVPCLTVRKNTERPITITEGTNILVGVDKDKIIKQSRKIIKGTFKKGKRPKYWDGKTAERIINILSKLYKAKRLWKNEHY